MSQWQPQQYDPRQHQQRIGGQPIIPMEHRYNEMDRIDRAVDRYTYGHARPPYGYAPQVAPKSTGLAIFLGLLIPGLGCMYAGKAALGIAILAAWMVSLILIIFIIGWLLVPACWIASGVLGYTTAQAWNREHGIIS